MTTTGGRNPGVTAAGIFEDPESPSFIPTVGRGPAADIPFWLFENRDVPLTEQYGLFFEHRLPALKSLRTAWWLALVLGFTGADRFYLGKPFTGALKLLTAGGAGIWWLIDLFRITTVHAADGRRAPLAGVPGTRRRLRLASLAVAAAVAGIGCGAALPPITSATAYVKSVLHPPPPPPVPEWITIIEASDAAAPAPVVASTGKAYVTYSFTAPAVAYLQPATGPAVTVVIDDKPAASSRTLDVPPGTYTLTVRTTGAWTLKAEEFRLPG